MEWSVTAGPITSIRDRSARASGAPSQGSDAAGRRRTRVLRLALLPLLLLPFLSTACNTSSDEQTALDAVNQSRAQSGLPALRWDDTLGDKARAWASHLAGDQALSHSSIAQGAAPGWHYLAENVGVSVGIAEAQRAFMASAPHRKNILDARFTSVGIGMVQAGGSLWIVQEFRG